MKSKIIEIKGVTKYYGKNSIPSLDGITMSIFQGEKFGFFGPNGAGKTTLLSILCDILKPSSGEVIYTIEEQEIALSKILSHVGFVPQDFAFYEELTALQNLQFFGGVYGLEKAVIEQRANDLLSVLGLLHVAKKKVKTFSGGMKRRLNLAIGLIHQPNVVFLDEPTVGVDVQSKMAITQHLEELNTQGVTLIYTSHHLREAEDFCDRIALIDHGKIIAIDTIDNLLSTHHAANLEALMLDLTGKDLRD